MDQDFQLPKEVSDVVAKLHDAGYEAYAVGGCVRDLLRGARPKDWDVTTSARPEDIQRLFPKSFYENAFLTVTVATGSNDPTLAEVEITTFRKEGKYTDKRHPDSVAFADTLEEDLARRDFTINAMAISRAAPSTQHAAKVVDPFGGEEDLKKKLIRAVGNPEQRFEEDALRMLRAVRFAVELGFAVEPKTRGAIEQHAGLLEHIAKERIRDEFFKILLNPRARNGVELLHDFGLLMYILPEVEEGINVENRPRVFTIWEHNLKALEYGAQQNFPLDVRIAALLHDAGKPRTKGPMKRGEWTFYGHDVVGGKMAAAALTRLKCPQRQVEKIATLIRWHLFKYEIDQDDAATTDSSIRRLIRRVGAANMNDLVLLRICDRMGMGVPKPVPYRLRHFQFRVEKMLREEEAPTPKMLKVNGRDIMEALGIAPGPRIGRVIDVLMQEVIDDPLRNEKVALLTRVRELNSVSDDELENMAEVAESRVQLVEDERVQTIKEKYYVK